MFKGNYEFAGIVARINHQYKFFEEMSKNYVSDKDAKIELTITDEDIEFEKNKAIQDDNAMDFPNFYLEVLAIYRKFLDYAWKENIFLFHSSSFAIDGNGFILTAPSGTGKSTHARFLKDVYGDKFQVINDDKPLIRYDGKDFWIYGTPWNGKHNLDTNTCVKLKGIFALYQNKENIIEKLNPSLSFNTIFKQTHRPTGKEATGTILNLLIKMSSDIPCYHFGCTNSIDSTMVSKKVIEEIINK